MVSVIPWLLGWVAPKRDRWVSALQRQGGEVHVAVTSTIVQMSTQFMLHVVMVQKGIHVSRHKDSSRDAKDETCVRWQVATVKDDPGTAASPVL